MEIILELQQRAQLQAAETSSLSRADRQMNQIVDGASGWQLRSFGCWTTIVRTEMEQGQEKKYTLLLHATVAFTW